MQTEKKIFLPCSCLSSSSSWFLDCVQISFDQHCQGFLPGEQTHKRRFLVWAKTGSQRGKDHCWYSISWHIKWMCIHCTDYIWRFLRPSIFISIMVKCCFPWLGLSSSWWEWPCSLQLHKKKWWAVLQWNGAIRCWLWSRCFSEGKCVKINLTSLLGLFTAGISPWKILTDYLIPWMNFQKGSMEVWCAF